MKMKLKKERFPQAEKEGFDSVWTIERILWPLKPQTQYPVTPDGSHPVEYQNVLDPLDVLENVALIPYWFISSDMTLV
jgi:hypothetical protein